MLIGKIIDALQRRDPTATYDQLGLYVGVTLAAGVIGLTNSYSTSIFRETIARNVQLALLKKLDRATFEALSNLPLGQVANRMAGDSRSICGQLETSIFPTLTSFCSLVATIIAMTQQDYRLAFVATACSCVAFVPSRIFRDRIVRLQKLLASANDEFIGAITESSSLAALVAYRNAIAAKEKQSRFSGLTDSLFHLRIQQTLTGGLAGIAAMLGTAIGPSVVLLLGIHLAISGQLSAGTIVSILIYQSRLSGPMGALGQLHLSIASLGVVMHRLLDIWDLPEETSGIIAFAPGPIHFDNVLARRGTRQILSGVNLNIDEGSHVALVGPSGAGKSSLAALLTRLYEPDFGSIRIGTTRLADFSSDSLRSSIAVVSQDPLILDLSFLDNITLASPNVDQARLDAVMEVTCLHEVLSRMPHGMATKLGQRGFRMSGGERQRVCLARALLQSPSILVLDEALNGLDVDMERRILAKLRADFVGRTLVIITHRLDALSELDQIIILDDGIVVGHGSPSDITTDDKWLKVTRHILRARRSSATDAIA